MKTKAVTKITFKDKNGEKFFGEGPATLLREIEATGSLRAAALKMDMAYTKALKMIKNAEAALGFSLTSRSSGGKSGGGSVLTPEGRAWLEKYEAYRDACIRANNELFEKFFPKVGCVIMASGLGKRFGSNKLMADFDGKPMFMRALEASVRFAEHRVVVTRHKEVADICREIGVDVVLHDLPYRSDTVRLGLEALGNIDACLFMPADQPLLKKETVGEIVKLWEDNRDNIIRPFHENIPGAPVLFPSWAFPELLTLPEGKGGGLIVKKYAERVEGLQVNDPYELVDVDTQETLEQLKQQIGKEV